LKQNSFLSFEKNSPKIFDHIRHYGAMVAWLNKDLVNGCADKNRIHAEIGNYTMKIYQLLILRTFFVLIAVFVSPGSYTYAGTDTPRNLSVLGSQNQTGSHFFTGLPVDKHGWTDFEAMIKHAGHYTDARVIFVSASEGKDSTGKVYTTGDVVF